VKVIQPNCRTQFTAADIDFIVSVFRTSEESSEHLIKLFSDPDSLDALLDHDSIFRALLENTGFVRVSRYFYFYVMVRHVLRRSGIEDRSVADYVAALMAEFSILQQMRCTLPNETQPLNYIFEMLAALQRVDEKTRFMIRAHVGNHSLFICGVFPDHIRYRAQFKGAPELEYYESLGSSNFKVASDHQLAQRYDLAPIYSILSEKFHAVRLALNDMSDRLLFLGDKDPGSIVSKPDEPSK
jgi:hypothetical protein